MMIIRAARKGFRRTFPFDFFSVRASLLMVMDLWSRCDTICPMTKTSTCHQQQPPRQFSAGRTEAEVQAGVEMEAGTWRMEAVLEVGLPGTRRPIPTRWYRPFVPRTPTRSFITTTIITTIMPRRLRRLKPLKRSNNIIPIRTRERLGRLLRVHWHR